MIAVKDIAFVRYQVTDLARMEAFLTDFGLRRAARTESALYMRAAGTTHHVHVSELGPTNETVGFGFYAQTADDLERLAAHLGKPVERSLEPGGGLRVRFVDPAGFVVDVLHGQAQQAPLSAREPIPANTLIGRRLGATVRLGPSPSIVSRLGRVAFHVPDFPRSFAFYRDVLGFRASDTDWGSAEQDVIGAFMHCGPADEWPDRHTLAMFAAQDGLARFDHSSYEVIDSDDVVQGGEFMKSRGWTHSGGIDHHIHGSQIFEFWRDPFGQKHERYTDGGLVNDGSPVGKVEFNLGGSVSERHR